MKAITLNKTTDYVIVRGANASKSEIYAADQLALYLEKISGAAVSVTTDETAETAKEIVVGKTNREADKEFDRAELGTDGFVIKTRGDKLFIVGGEMRGTLYGVYSYLENYLGCRFYTAKFEKIPKLDAIPFTEIDEDKQIPVFEVRNSGWADFYDHGLSAKLKLNCSHGRGRIREELGGSAYFAGSGCHTLCTLAEMSGPAWNNEPCLSDEAVYETVLKNVLKTLRSEPGAKYVSVSQNDSDTRDWACKCEKCQALYEKTGSRAGIYIKFANRIAEAIKDEYPDVMVHTFAYKFTKEAPKNITVADNVMVQFCTIEACFRHPLAECHVLGDDFKKLLGDWAKICKYISVWDYTTDFYYYSISFPNFKAIRDNMLLFAENNVRKVYEQGNWQTTSGEFSELRGYLLARLLWDPYMSEEQYYAYMDEFLRDYYGEGAGKIREFIDYMHDVTENHHLGIYDTPSHVYPNKLITLHENGLPEGFDASALEDAKSKAWSQIYEYYTKLEPNEIIAKGKQLFDEARSLTTDPVLLAHIDKSSLQIGYTESFYLRDKLDAIKQNIAKAIAELAPDIDKDALDAAINAISAPLEKEYAEYNSALFDRFFEHGVNFTAETRRLEKAKKETYNFSNTPYNWGPNTWGT